MLFNPMLFQLSMAAAAMGAGQNLPRTAPSPAGTAQQAALHCTSLQNLPRRLRVHHSAELRRCASLHSAG